MNATRYQPIVATATEMWTLTSYLAAMGMVVLHYDCLLTINDEIRLVWPGPPSLPKVLYYINRYLPALYLIFANYHGAAAFRPALSTSGLIRFSCPFDALVGNPNAHQNLSCHAWIVTSTICVAVATTSATVLLTIRTAAIYRGVAWAVRLLWLSFAVFQGLRVSAFFSGAASIFESLRYSPISNHCVPGNTGYRTAALLGISIIHDLLLLILTVIKAIRNRASLRADSIFYALIRDEILFFLVIVTIRIFWLTLSDTLWGVVVYAEWGLESTLTSRFFLNLRSITAREQSISEARTVPSVLRTRSGRRRAIETMTSYIGSEMDESILNYIATPNELDVQLANGIRRG